MGGLRIRRLTPDMQKRAAPGHVGAARLSVLLGSLVGRLLLGLLSLDGLGLLRLNRLSHDSPPLMASAASTGGGFCTAWITAGDNAGDAANVRAISIRLLCMSVMRPLVLALTCDTFAVRYPTSATIAGIATTPTTVSRSVMGFPAISSAVAAPHRAQTMTVRQISTSRIIDGCTGGCCGAVTARPPAGRGRRRRPGRRRPSPHR